VGIQRARAKIEPWDPEHPETRAAWPFWQVLLSKIGISYSDAMDMYPEEIADALEAVEVAHDCQLWHRANEIPDG
jgi:hypothetical protein